MSIKLKSLFVLFFALTLSFSLTAQTAEIRGFLYSDTDKEPLIFSNVFLKGTPYGAASDVNGFFSITKIPPGTYTLIITSLGYDSISREITLKPGQRHSENFTLAEKAQALKEVNITAAKQDLTTVVNVGVTKIAPRQIDIVPSFGGEADIAQYLQTIPGVIFTGDQGGQLYIRGGTPVQTLVLMDGMIVYNPFHSIGLFSVFDTDLLRNIDVYTGGYGAQYGGRVSAVMDVTTRDGNKKRFGGVASASPFSSKLLF
ncbi:MAG: hypothetical protein EOO01_20340 [Chitinophagaceae bacterium]|nr:MAG: hypothetical protein EOO01_20340 [Chitinophagaceae bacterium]